MITNELTTVLLCLLGYLLGSIPFGLLLTRLAGLGDIRGMGSGNIGATNVLRTGRKDVAAATLILDAMKGAAAVLVARTVSGHFGGGQFGDGQLGDGQLGDGQAVAMYAGLAAVLGHMFPIWLGFKGGKGAATGLGVGLAASWPIGVAGATVWLIVAAVARFSSLATLSAFAAAPIVALVLEEFNVVKLAFTIAVLVFVRHQANIRRLLNGTEPRIGRRKAERA